MLSESETSQHEAPKDAPARAPRRPRRAAPSRAASPAEADTAPRLTLPTIPTRRVPNANGRGDTRADSRTDSGRHRTLLGIHRAEQALRDAPDYPDDPWDRQEPPGAPDQSWDRSWDRSGPRRGGLGGANSWEGLPALTSGDAYGPQNDRLSDSSGRLRATSAARPLPAVSRRDRKLVARAVRGGARQAERRAGRRDDTGVALLARDALSGERPSTALALSTASVPDLIAYRPVQPRRRVDTRAILDTARKPWSITRISLALLAAVLAIITTYSVAGESPQPLMFSQAAAGAGAVDVPWPVNAITAKVQPETQLKRSDLYDNIDQFNLWGPADCSAAVLSEVLTAYGVPDASIGRMIDDLGPDISPHGGLLTYDGFNKAAQLHGYRADLYLDKPLTYKQMQYLTDTLGIPVIVNVHISYGYYHFFAGGHFMVMTYGDDAGVRLVDSSEYYVKYLPMDVFKSMFTQRTAVIVPKDFQYTLPT